MKNFVAPGNMVTMIAPTGGVVSGQLALIGAVAGVVACDAAAGAPVELAVEGIFDLAKTPGDSMTAGAVAKALIATGVIDSGGTQNVGWVTQAAASGAATARVRLVPGL
jgi:predicted RecA/RadA family phage recombinase